MTRATLFVYPGMGHLSKMMHEGRGPRPNRGSNKNPLRKIVDHRYLGDRRMERLECGHEQFAVCDLMGETNAVRRRCRECGKAQARP